MLSVLLTAVLAAAQATAPSTPAFVADNKSSATTVDTVTPAPKPVLTIEMRGDISMARKEYRQAIEYYNEVKPPTAVSLNKIGIAYHQLSDLDQAKRYYERAVKMNKRYAEAINNLGTIYYAKGNYRKAVGQYNKALKHAPKSASIQSNLGTAWFARKKYDKALECYIIAVTLDPDVFEHRGTAGVLLQERSVQERAKYYYYMSKLYAQVAMNDRALQYMRKALEEGFKDRKKFVEEPEFAGLQELPEFQELLALQPRVL